jgi:hypothetical protein
VQNPAVENVTSMSNITNNRIGNSPSRSLHFGSLLPTVSWASLLERLLPLGMGLRCSKRSTKPGSHPNSLLAFRKHQCDIRFSDVLMSGVALSLVAPNAGAQLLPEAEARHERTL